MFKDKQISLIDKRRLMRFFTFVSRDFEEKPELHGKESTPFIDFLTSTFALERTIAETIVFALAFCTSLQGPWTSSPIKLPILIMNRAGIAGLEAGATLPPFQRPLRTLPFPRRPLWRLRGARPGILSRLGRQRKHLRSESQRVLDFTKIASVSPSFSIAQGPGRNDRLRLGHIFRGAP